MITSEQLQNLSVDEFMTLYTDSIIKKKTESIIQSVLYEQFNYKKSMLTYEINDNSSPYLEKIIENLKSRLSISSIYITDSRLFIDWSLPSPK